MLGASLLLAGMILTVYAIVAGEMRVGLVLFVIPYLYGSGPIGVFAVILIILGLLVLITAPFIRASRRSASQAPQAPLEEGERVRKEFGSVVLIGPVPIVFGSSNRSALLALVVAAMVIMALTLVFLFLRG